jgi:hypothetical protein
VRVYFPSLSPLCLATCHLYLSSLSSLPLLYFPLHRNLCYLLTLSSPLLSTSESLDINRAFSFEFAERMHNVFAYDKDDFWLLFPDKSEASLGIQSWEKRYANIYTYIHRHTFIQNHTHTHILTQLADAAALHRGLSGHRRGAAPDYGARLVSEAHRVRQPR